MLNLIFGSTKSYLLMVCSLFLIIFVKRIIYVKVSQVFGIAASTLSYQNRIDSTINRYNEPIIASNVDKVEFSLDSIFSTIDLPNCRQPWVHLLRMVERIYYLEPFYPLSVKLPSFFDCQLNQL